MKVLVLGASGATGRLVTNQLFRKGIPSRLVARENSLIPEEILNNKNVEIVRGNITEFDNYTHTNLISDCDAIVCCLGHNLTFKGIFGKPRKLVYEAIKNICYAINKKGNHKYKLILMNTTGNIRKDETKNISLGEKIILAILKTLLPPHSDNISASDYLLNEIGYNNTKIEWVIVRPDTLINHEQETKYEVYESLTRSPLSNPGKTSRINVSHFIAELLTDDELWKKWNNKMPVLYNTEE